MPQPTAIPPKPTEPPTVGTEPPVHTPVPIEQAATDAVPADQAEQARQFWAPVSELLNEWWLRTGPDQHLSDGPVLPPVTGWEQPGQPTDATHRVADRIALLLSETTAERLQREQDERDAAHALAGETQRQRTERHKREKRARKAVARRRQLRHELLDSRLRAKRFRRWCILTALSASVGWYGGLVQICGAIIHTAGATGDQLLAVGAGLFLLGIGYAVDWYLRGGTRDGGAKPVTDVHGKVRIPLLIATRVPVASALTALLTYTPGTLT